MVRNKKFQVGIKVKRWVLSRVLININNNLSYYKKIIPCGLSNNEITSIYDLGVKKITNVDNNIIKIFTKNLAKI